MSTPDLVYHYTSLSTLQVIIQTNTLLATETSMLNDPHENSFFTRNRMEITELFRINKLDYSEDDLFEETSLIAYSLSASKDRDNVAMWRDYADMGRGVAIGIDTSIPLKVLTRIEDPELRYLKDGETHTIGHLPALQKVGWASIKYDNGTAMTALAAALEEQGSKQLDPSLFDDQEDYEVARQEFRDGIHGEVILALKTANLTTKKAGWRYENEWRHIVHESRYFGNSKPAYIRSTQYGLARTLRLVHGHSTVSDWSEKDTHCSLQLPIKSVVLGPNTSTPDFLIEQLLEGKGYRDVGVSASDSQFR